MSHTLHAGIVFARFHAGHIGRKWALVVLGTRLTTAAGTAETLYLVSISLSLVSIKVSLVMSTKLRLLSAY